MLIAFYSVPWLALQLEAGCACSAEEASWRTEVSQFALITSARKYVISGPAQTKPLAHTYTYKSLFAHKPNWEYRSLRQTGVEEHLKVGGWRGIKKWQVTL